MLTVSFWSSSSPAKSWLVSKSSNSRFIASVGGQLEEESFERMESLEIGCENTQIDIRARYVRFDFSSCHHTGLKLSNESTGTKANIFSASGEKTTEYMYLKKGDNNILVQFTDLSGNQITNQIKVVSINNPY